MNNSDSEFSQPIRRAQGITPVDSYLTGSWEALGNGAPIMVGLAQICSQAMVDQPSTALDALSAPARALLFAARHKGIFEIKGANTAFEAASRLCAVYVALDDERMLAFRDRTNTEITAIFIDAFRELCAAGCVLHHLHRDFSLSRRGFEQARLVNDTEAKEWLEKAVEYGEMEFGLHE